MDENNIFKRLNGRYFVFVKQLDMFVCGYGRLIINPGALCTIEEYDNVIHFINSNNYLYGTYAYIEIANHFYEYMREISKEEVEEVLLYKQFKSKVVDDQIFKYLLDKVNAYDDNTDKYCHNASYKFDLSNEEVNELNDKSPADFINTYTKKLKK